MNERDILYLIRSKKLAGNHKEIELEETHISWVILQKKFAFKIKKPIQLSFLDFSTLKKRKFYCKKEIDLNSRFSKGIYLKIIPIKKLIDSVSIDGTKGKTIDYAVMMKRLNSQNKMDFMLNENKVKTFHINKLSKKISGFHKKAGIIKKKSNSSTFGNLFSELSSYKYFIEKNLGKTYYKIVADAEKKSVVFLDQHRKLLNDRSKSGFVRDCHGDLHSKNIFLYSSPILFDCIEFNDEYRFIDILYEIAFLCMDLDFYGKFNLSELFRKRYLVDSDLSMNKEELQLFNYYKACRANIHAKVGIIKALAINNEGETFKSTLKEIKTYLNLIKLYNSYY